MAKKRPAARRRTPRATIQGSRAKPKARSAPARFIGREGSPVLDRYPPKDPALSVRGPPTPAVKPPASSRPSGAPSSPTLADGPRPTASGDPAPTTHAPALGAAPGTTSPPIPLISLERPFDLDEFSRMLGESTIRVEVPREDLAEALRRISDFMGFGIYVYSFRVRPAPEELLKRFVVELQRVDFSPSQHEWTAFEETGRSDSPFGPSGSRR